VALRSRERGRSPGAGPAPGPRPAAPAASSALLGSDACAEAGPVSPDAFAGLRRRRGVRGLEDGVVGERTVVVGESVVAGAGDHATEQLRHLHDALRTFCSIW